MDGGQIIHTQLVEEGRVALSGCVEEHRNDDSVFDHQRVHLVLLVSVGILLVVIQRGHYVHLEVVVLPVERVFRWGVESHVTDGVASVLPLTEALLGRSPLEPVLVAQKEESDVSLDLQ